MWTEEKWPILPIVEVMEFRTDISYIYMLDLY